MAENLCYTAMKKFQEKYGVIENVSEYQFGKKLILLQKLILKVN